jgi:hypothetical protein
MLFSENLKMIANDKMITDDLVLAQIESVQREYENGRKQIQQLQSQIQIQQYAEEIFDFHRGCNCHVAGFDWEGDEDILKLNFGGKYVDIQRSVLTKPLVGQNNFSALFQN